MLETLILYAWLSCRWLVVKNSTFKNSYATHFLIFSREKNCRILVGLRKRVFMNHPIMLLDRDNKTKLVSASFS